jgi:hypothetical protein
MSVPKAAPWAFHDPADHTLKTAQLTLVDGGHVDLPWHGTMTAGVVHEQPAPARVDGGHRELPTPRTTDFNTPGSAYGHIRADRLQLRDVNVLLPTPQAHETGRTPEAHIAMRAGLEGGPRRTITSLEVLAKNGMRQPDHTTAGLHGMLPHGGGAP